MEIGKVAFYPGCSLEGTSSAYADSMKEVLTALGIQVPELSGWSCCGATSAHAMDKNLYLSLNLRNLALAEEQGFTEILAPCAACYHRLASANFEFSEDKALLERLNSQAGLNYKGTVKVRNILDLMHNVVGQRAIASRVSNPLTGKKVACYYGCLNTRIPRMKSFDTMDYPMSMDSIISTIGAQPLDWSYKTECCGGSLFLTSEATSAKLVSKILKDAIACGADVIAAACPMCQSNLDTKQKDIQQEFGISKPIPVVFITQLMGLAFGKTGAELSMNKNFVPMEAVGK
jgi:heterodisulfide reductase subunit B